MLEMESERLDFTDQLAPEDGYVLDSCVGTTYSLDMRALLGACLSLAGGIFRSGSLGKNPISSFASIEKLKGKMIVFCEKGRIKNEDKTNRLAILMEPLINQVVVSRPKNANSSIASFHPKVWLLDFMRTADSSHRYRLLVTSRNLTLSGAWDVAVRLDGNDTGKPVPESAGIVQFLNYLYTNRGVENDRETRKILKRLSERIATVRFEVDSAYYDDYDFLPFGPPRSGLLNASETPLFTDKYSKAVIISPFLSNEGPLKRFAFNRVGDASKDNFYLLSKESELNKIDEDLLSKYSCYTPKSWLSDVALETDDGDEVNPLDYSDLHAKVYLTERYAQRNLYLGSLNASRNAITGNVEALLRLGIKKRGLKVEDLIESLTGEKRPFGPYFTGAIPNDFEIGLEEKTRHIFLDKCFHAAAKLLEFERVEASSSKERIEVDYSLALFNGFDTNLELTLAPYLASDKSVKLSSPNGKVVFEKISARCLSEFFVVRGVSTSDNYEISSLVRCPDSVFYCDEKRDDRIKRVLETILDTTPDALVSYIALAFGVAPSKTGASQHHIPKTSSRDFSSHEIGGLYEPLLKALAVTPNAQDQLAYAKLMLSFLPSKFDDDQIKALRNMINQFEKAVKRHGS